VAGEYAIQRIDPEDARALSLSLSVAVPGAYRDVSITVDGRLVGETAGRSLGVDCRFMAGSGYAFVVVPDNRVFTLFYYEGDRTTILVTEPTTAIRRGEASNRIELSCTGTTITARVNDTVVATVQDARNGDGGVRIRAAVPPATTADARFDNLVVTQR
jgi:hypothetical protein